MKDKVYFGLKVFATLFGLFMFANGVVLILMQVHRPQMPPILGMHNVYMNLSTKQIVFASVKLIGRVEKEVWKGTLKNVEAEVRLKNMVEFHANGSISGYTSAMVLGKSKLESPVVWKLIGNQAIIFNVTCTPSASVLRVSELYKLYVQCDDPSAPYPLLEIYVEYKIDANTSKTSPSFVTQIGSLCYCPVYFEDVKQVHGLS